MECTLEEKILSAVRKTLERNDVSSRSFGENKKELRTPDYSLATNFSLSDHTTEGWIRKGHYQIDFFFPVHIPQLPHHPLVSYDCELRILVYCRHENWGRDSMHKAVNWFVSGPYESRSMYTGIRQWEELTVSHWKTLEKLTAFYKKQGVKPELIEEMKKAVAKLREENPEEKRSISND